MTIQKIIGSKIEGKTKTKVLTAGVLVAGMIAASLMATSPAHAATTFTVNIPGDTKDVSTSDGRCDVNTFGSGDQCTLRAAIQQANASPGADAIHFDIPDSFGAGTKTIRVGATGNGPLPAITGTVTIDGYTQPGAHPNTKAVGDDAKLMVELDGTDAGFNLDGLQIEGASNCVIRGLVINRFGGGVEIGEATGSAIGNRVEGNFIGTDPSGNVDEGNRVFGVALRDGSSGNVVGGTSPARRNVISGNDNSGIFLTGESSKNSVQGNYIGTDRTGTEDLGNLRNGLFVSGFNNTFGGTTSGAGNLISGNDDSGLNILSTSHDNHVLGNRIGTTANGKDALGNGKAGVSVFSNDTIVGDGTSRGNNTIAFNTGDGVEIGGGDLSTGNRVLSNSIFGNGGLGIDLLGLDGPDANDPDDHDFGANNHQNFPVLSSARFASGKTTVKGTLDSNPGQKFRIQFFANFAGTDEAQKLIGQKTVSTNSSGDASFTFSTKKRVPTGQTITAAATRVSTGDTSELSAAAQVQG